MERVMTNDIHVLKQKAIYYMEKKNFSCQQDGPALSIVSNMR